MKTNEQILNEQQVQQMNSEAQPPSRPAAPKKKRPWYRSLLWGVVFLAAIIAVVVGIITEVSGTISDHDYVDLGLSVRWATCNVGASSPGEYGNYYAWGEISTKESYKESNSKTYERSMDDIACEAAYDAARAEWGGSWRLPTRVEIDELCDKCTWEWTIYDGHKGYKVIGPNGNSIFLPAAGGRYGPSLHDAEEYGIYWSSTPWISTSKAYALTFFMDGDGDDGASIRRFFGGSVRPVVE